MSGSDRAGFDLRSLLVVGTGLIGTSIGLAAGAAGVEVWLDDSSPDNLAAACARGAGRPWAEAGERIADHAVVCVPPLAVAPTVAALQRRRAAATVSDTASAKEQIVAEVDRLGGSLRTFVGGHPMAGRERGGPLAARGDLFVGRPWVLTPVEATDSRTLTAAAAVAERCGAVVAERSPDDHDRAVALVSHVPQVVASAVAARLLDAVEPDVVLTGQALRDLTRIADSDPDLWSEILLANAEQVVAALRPLAGDLADLVAAMEAPAAPAAVRDEIAALVRRGRAGRSRLPGRHGEAPRATATVAVVVRDRPGQLHGLLGVLAAADVNVEDLRIDHAVGQPTGVVEVVVAPESAARAIAALHTAGWSAQDVTPGDA